MSFEVPSEAPPRAPCFTADDVTGILLERGWLSADCGIVEDAALNAWLARAAELLGPHVGDRASLAELLALVFEYDASIALREPANQAVLTREGAREVIRELANRILGGGDVDS